MSKKAFNLRRFAFSGKSAKNHSKNLLASKKVSLGNSDNSVTIISVSGKDSIFGGHSCTLPLRDADADNDVIEIDSKNLLASKKVSLENSENFSKDSFMINDATFKIGTFNNQTKTVDERSFNSLTAEEQFVWQIIYSNWSHGVKL